MELYSKESRDTPKQKGLKLFQEKNLNGILEEAGNLKADWYYPYPDYKFPMTIHSDRHLPASGELHMRDYNFDRLRLDLFQESQVYNTLLSNDLYPQFANSFLLVIGKEQPQTAPVYVKFSNERDQKLSIYTEISEAADGQHDCEESTVAEESGSSCTESGNYL